MTAFNSSIAILFSIVFSLFLNITLVYAEKSYDFPLRISKNGRYFVDQKDRPFLINGDTAWSLIGQLNLKDAEFYMDRRKLQGFNAILVNLIEHKFAQSPPKNAAGQEPFRIPGELTTPEEPYFSYADAIIKLAARKGLVVFLTPAYLGWQGGDEGWFKPIKKGGPIKLRQYGRYIGQRYKRCPNIIWVMGGDYTPAPADRWTVDELAEGIRGGGATQLMTCHCGQVSPALAFGDRRWLDFNNVYSYAVNLYVDTLNEYNRKPVKPFIMMESFYEGEHKASPERIRRQAYWSFLTGAAGQFYGNNPVWNFSSPVKVFPTDLRWEKALDSRGAQDICHLWKLFQGLRWNDLEPDIDHRYLLAEYGYSGIDRYAMAAAAKDSKLVIVYITSTVPTKLKLDSARICAPFQAFWYDTTNGEKILITSSAFLREGKMEVQVPMKNSSGGKDWLLVLEAERN